MVKVLAEVSLVRILLLRSLSPRKRTVLMSLTLIFKDPSSIRLELHPNYLM